MSKTFGGVAAVSAVSLTVGRGESIGLVGPNGAGKTTLFNCIGGQLRPDRGSVELEGTDLLDLPTYKRARLGIGRTYQRIEVFPDMTVWDHLVVALGPVGAPVGCGRTCATAAAPPKRSRNVWPPSSSWWVSRTGP